MIAVTKIPCPECGTANPAGVNRCRVCGTIRHFEAPPRPGPHRLHVAPTVVPRCEPHKVTVQYLLAGIAIAILLTYVPVANYMGWFFASLCHEIGHCVVAWAAGCPAFPAIRLDGHAAANHLGQSKALCVGLWLVIAFCAWHFRDRRRGVWIFGLLALVYPVFAFTSLRDLSFLLAGQAGELAFAGVFFWRGLVGGFSESPAERALYLGCACFLLGSNLSLNYGLIADPAVREIYRSNGSFGLTNDYVRAARQLGTSLESIAAFMLLASLTVAPLAWWLSRPRRRGHAQSV